MKWFLTETCLRIFRSFLLSLYSQEETRLRCIKKTNICFLKDLSRGLFCLLNRSSYNKTNFSKQVFLFALTSRARRYSPILWFKIKKQTKKKSRIGYGRARTCDHQEWVSCDSPPNLLCVFLR